MCSDWFPEWERRACQGFLAQDLEWQEKGFFLSRKSIKMQNRIWLNDAICMQKTN